MDGKIHHYFLACIIIILMLTSNIIVNSGNADNENNIASSSQPANARAESWIVSDQLEGTVQVGKGNDHFVYLDSAAGVLREKKLPQADAGLNELALQALAKVPAWLQDDLALKLRETASVPARAYGFDVAPSFADMDNDGDLDMILGENMMLDPGRPGLSYYENMGTKHEPIFILNDDLFSEIIDVSMGISDSFEEQCPTIADIDGDFDYDIMIGTLNGGVFLLENTGSPYDPLFENIVRVNGMLANEKAAPHMVDFDSDSDFDVVLGDGTGSLHYFPNSGTNIEPQWSRAILNPLAEIQVARDAVPYLYDLDNDGDLDITVSDENNNIIYYRCITSGVTKSYVLDETMYFGLPVGNNNHPVLADIDSDGLVEFLSVNRDGIIQIYDNYGFIRDPQWTIWSSYKAVPGVSYYPPVEYLDYLEFSVIDRFSNVILNAFNQNPLWVDEVAFAIAHTAADILRNMDDIQVGIFKDNAEYLYKIDPFLEYAEIKEYNAGTVDYYSNVEYKAIDGGSTYTRVFPREIYYWYIVHPKITEETPGYVDPNTGNIAPPSTGGRFWREYLFYHSDSAYPSDTSGSPSDGIDDYPTSFGPPLLKDLLAGVKYLWNGTRWTAPGNRVNDYGDHALIRVSNWVGKTLILNQQEVSDDERPTQPVRVAHHHNGNCGELQDLTAAGARTALIPVSGVNLMAEDHAWNEFYENGWHQYDNHWSDSGSHIDKYNMYWDGWGERGGSGIWHHKGNDDTTDVTSKYIPPAKQSRVVVKVTDRNGYPVDGARVMMGSHWMAERNIDPNMVSSTFPFPGIWNYTDTSGISEFRLAKQNFTIKVLSKLGNAVQNKTYIDSSGLYHFNFTLEGVLPRPFLPANEVSDPYTIDPAYKITVEYSVNEGVQFPPNPENGHYHPEPQSESNTIISFMSSSLEFRKYHEGTFFSAFQVREGATTYSSPEIILDGTDDLYFVLSNLNTMETSKNVNFIITLYEPLKDIPFVKIDAPVNNSKLFAGDKVRIEGSVSDEDGIKSVRLMLKDLTSGEVKLDMLLNYNNDNIWFYDWDTRKFAPGIYAVKVIAEDNKGLANSIQIFVELILAGAPEINILNPAPNDSFEIGEWIEFNGTVFDNGHVKTLTITLGEDSPVYITNSINNGFWQYFWDTRYVTAGFVEVKITAEDNDNKFSSASVVIELIEPPIPPDTTAPEVTIATPDYGTEITLGSTVTIAGYAYDDGQLASIMIKLGAGHAGVEPVLTPEGEWSYEWNTGSASPGEVVISVDAKDASGNIGSDEVTVELVVPPVQDDNNPPELRITAPLEDSRISSGTIIVVSGTAADISGITRLEYTYDNGENWHDITGSLTSTSWHFNLDSRKPLLVPNIYELTVEATDGAGNSAVADVSIFIIDDTAPSLEIILPVQNSGFKQDEIIEVTGNAGDNFGVARLQMKLNDAKRWRSYTRDYDEDTGEWRIDVHAVDLQLGTNIIRLRVVDEYGNENEESVTVKVSAASSEPSGDTVENSIDFLLGDPAGNALCGIMFLIIIVAAYGILAKRRTDRNDMPKKRKKRRKRI